RTFVELAEMERDRAEFDSVTTWINSGDAAHEPHIRRLVEHGHHERGGQRVEGSQFVDGLGSSEMGHSSFRIIHTAYSECYDRCVGVPQSWVEAVVLDDVGRPVPDGTVGRLGVRSPSVTPGYWNASTLTHRSRVNGYWVTGDLVYRDHLGCFYHVDRITDRIATATGLLYSLQTEECILKHHDAVEDCTVVGVPDRTSPDLESAIALAVPRRGHRLDSATLEASVNRILGALDRPLLERVEIVDRDDIPVGVTGKVLKRTIRDRFAADVH
ncbi:MAG: AMP-binding protein, partial [Gemmatimonadetes bacterium]|nr:AMP-binding protein [Gemmatimonadota bacterium]